MTHLAQQPGAPADGALDAIVQELRALLAASHAAEHACERSATVARWLETLFACIARCNNEELRDDDGDDAEDTADVLAMVLTACAQNAWKATCKEGKSDCIGDLLFQGDRMKQTFKFLWEVVTSSDVAGQPSAALTACEVLYALGRLAQSEPDIHCMLHAWESFPGLSRRLAQSSPSSTLQQGTKDQRLAICYVRFIDNALSDTKETVKQPSISILSDLVGDDIVRWREHKWERQWQLTSSSRLSTETFGSETACEAMVKRLLRGFSIPQVDADAVASPLSLPSFLLSLDLNELLELRHKVDVTLVRDGVTYPDWKVNDVLRFEDIVDALRSHKYTIGIRGVHARSRLIANVCTALQNELKQHVNANIYFWLLCVCGRTGTPPGEQGFNLHIDDHCVFVIQLRGKKNWHLKDHVGDLPVLYSDLSESPASGSTEDLVLAPGSILYIPRGTPHCADTRDLDEDSIHLTIGVEIEEQFTKGALVLELLSFDNVGIDQVHFETIKAVMETEVIRNEMRRGLMSWHLGDDSVFRQESVKLLTKLNETLDVALDSETAVESKRRVARTKKLIDEALQVSDSKLSLLRERLLEDRHAFLSSRQQLTTLFTRLHRCLHIEDLAVTAEPNCSFTANKKVKR